MRTLRKIEKVNTHSNIIKMHKKVAAYARVSLDSESLNNSLSNQISYYKNLITNTKGYEFVKVYYDKGISGTNTKKRDAFNEMIEDAKAGKIDLILTKSISRFARNTVDLLKTVRMLKSINVEVRFEKEKINSMSADGELMLSILASFAQSESESISQNLKWAQRKRYEKGKDQFRPVFGYTYKNGKYQIYEKEAKIVREVFKLFLSGKTYSEIGKIINRHGIKSRKNNIFWYANVKCMLKNEKYMGDSILQKHYVANSLTHSIKTNKGELPMYHVKGTHPAIVSEEDYKKAQILIKDLAESRNYKKHNKCWHTNLVVCPICKSPFVKKGKYIRCKGSMEGKCNNRRIIPIKKLKEIVVGMDINKIESMVFKKTAIVKPTNRRYSPKRSTLNDITKEDFIIIWEGC